jgi:glutamate dehydrogenase/leucine dehydrogenase/N-dimethylarginine dimethylaminohydrolase
METLISLITPKYQIHTRFQFRLDNGLWSPLVDAWRFVTEAPGKGGIRAVRGVVNGDIVALDVEMDGKPSDKTTVEGRPLRGAKGGSNIDLQNHSTGQKVRWQRGWVSSTEGSAWKNEHRVAYGPLFDIPAPDKGTSPKDVNLMDYFADEHNRWLVQHAKAVLPWLDQKDPRLARDLRILRDSVRREPIRFDEEGTQLELPYVDRILRLREQKRLTSLRLLACVTGKTAPNKNLPLGRGGIRNRNKATGLGLFFAVLKWWQLLGVIASDAKTLEGKTVTIEGFGNVGYWAAHSFIEGKATVQGIAEFDKARRIELAFYCPSGFTLEAIKAMDDYQKQNDTLFGFEETAVASGFGITLISKEAFWRLQVDLLAPCATENTITPEVARILGALFLAEGANGPTTPEADQILEARGIPRNPDQVANSGGMHVSYFEILQDVEENGEAWTEEKVDHELQRVIEERVEEVYAYSQSRGISMREAGVELTLKNRLPKPQTWTVRRIGRRLIRRFQLFMRTHPFKRWLFIHHNGLGLLYYPARVFYLVEPNNNGPGTSGTARMDMEKQPEPTIVSEQWRQLHSLLIRIGAPVVVDRASEHAPNEVIAGDAGLAYEKNGIRYFIASRFREPSRQGETLLFEAAFERRGFHVIRNLFNSGEYFGGEGDLLEHQGILFGGWVDPSMPWARSHASAHEKVAQTVGLPLVLLKLVNPDFYHLDTALTFLDDDTVMAYMPAFDGESQMELERRFDVPGKRLIRLSEADAKLFAANAIVFGRKLVMNTVSDELAAELNELGFEVFRTPMSEFRKSGAATKASVLHFLAFRLFTWSYLLTPNSRPGIIRRDETDIAA